jgi:3-methylcrotonyl-CoA carboxylase alpha subunit/acetyl-CoA/propionyl-CoA carboxylase biotin carboxyl carrier protein
MPGTVLDVRVVDGERVEAGQVLVVLEAMKMEAPLRAPFPGTVVGVDVSAGSQVALGAVVCVVSPIGDVGSTDPE